MSPNTSIAAETELRFDLKSGLISKLDCVKNKSDSSAQNLKLYDSHSLKFCINVLCVVILLWKFEILVPNK